MSFTLSHICDFCEAGLVVAGVGAVRILDVVAWRAMQRLRPRQTRDTDISETAAPAPFRIRNSQIPYEFSYFDNSVPAAIPNIGDRNRDSPPKSTLHSPPGVMKIIGNFDKCDSLWKLLND